MRLKARSRIRPFFFSIEQIFIFGAGRDVFCFSIKVAGTLRMQVYGSVSRLGESDVDGFGEGSPNQKSAFSGRQ
jgi:hypothetical protein